MGVGYPVALDPDYAVWRAFANHYWPAVYIADAEGRIRHHHFGEGGYDECERVIQQLLLEAGAEGIDDELVSVVADGLRGAGGLGDPRVARDVPRLRAGSELRVRHADELDRRCRLNQWTLDGRLDDQEPRASRAERGRGAARVPLPRPRRPSRHGAARARHARAVPRARRRRASGRRSRPRRRRGRARNAVAEQRLHQLIREPGSITDRTLRDPFLAPGAEAYCFTFG